MLAANSAECMLIKMISYENSTSASWLHQDRKLAVKSAAGNKLNYSISWYATMMASWVKIGGRLRPVQRSTRFA